MKAAVQYAHYVLAGGLRCDHEIPIEDASAGRAFVGSAIESSVRSAGYSPRSSFAATVPPGVLTLDGPCVCRNRLS